MREECTAVLSGNFAHLAAKSVNFFYQLSFSQPADCGLQTSALLNPN